MRSLWSREPVLVVAAVESVVVVAIAFGAPITAEQLAAVGGSATAIAALVARSQVEPTSSRKPPR